MQFLISDQYDGPNESNILNYGVCWLSNGVYYAQNASGQYTYPMTQYPDIYIGFVPDEVLPPNYALTNPLQQAYSYNVLDEVLYPTPIGANRLLNLRRAKMIESYTMRNYNFYINHFRYNDHTFYVDSKVIEDMDIVLRHILMHGDYPDTPREWIDVWGVVVPLPEASDFKAFYQAMNDRRLEIRNIYHEVAKQKASNITTYVDYYAFVGAAVPTYFSNQPSEPSSVNDSSQIYPPPSV